MNSIKFFMAAVATAIGMSATAADKTAEGLSYFLPKTAVRVSVLVERKTTQPGQLADFSELYFKKAAQPTTVTDYRIVGIRFASEGLPDSGRQFTVAIDKKHSVLSVDCDANGVLLAINDKAPHTAEPQAFKPAPKQEPLNPRDFMSQDILAAGNLPKMAQLVAQEIYDIRDSRNQLSRGEADNMPKDGEQLRLMYAQLDTQERALMQLFQGTTTVDTTETVVTFVPTKETKRQTVFRFSKKFGLLTPDDFSGEPFYVDVDDLGTMPDAPETPEAAKKEKDDFQLGVVLPGKIRLTLTDGQNTKSVYETYAAQFGRVEMLSGALFGKKFTSKIQLDPTNGGIVELKTEPLE